MALLSICSWTKHASTRLFVHNVLTSRSNLFSEMLPHVNALKTTKLRTKKNKELRRPVMVKTDFGCECDTVGFGLLFSLSAQRHTFSLQRRHVTSPPLPPNQEFGKSSRVGRNQQQ